MGCVKDVVQVLVTPFLDTPGGSPQPAQPAYTPPPNSITTATPGPQVRIGQPSQGGFQVLGVRPRNLPGVPALQVPGPGVPPARAIPPGDKSGAGPGTDATKGLLKKPGTGKTLLS